MARKRTQKPEHSPAWQLLALVWKHSLKESSHSWIRLNRSMHDALCLAISSGCSFNIGDFAGLGDAFRFYHWGVNVEGLYGLAVIEDNLSAAKSFEHWKERGPFIADDVGSRGGYDSRTYHNRQRTRLAVGFTFPWQGEQVTVTSFSVDGTSLTACSYKPQTKDDPYSNKVLHRYKITAADIQADRKDRKRRDALQEVAAGLTKAKRTLVLKSLGYTSGIITDAQWDKLSPERIEQAIKKVS